MPYDPDKVFAFYSEHVSGLKRTGKDNVRAVGFCPFHADEVKPSASILLTEGLFKCFMPDCGVELNIVSFCRKLNMNIPVWAGGKNWKRIYEKILKDPRDQAFEYLLHRGIPIEYIQELYDNNEFGQNEYEDMIWIVFPIYSPEGGALVGLNKVSINTNDKRTNGTLMGSYWVDSKFDWNKPIIMVEAVINAISINVSNLGFQGLAIIMAENSKIPSHILGNSIFMFDNDVAGYSAARRYSRMVDSGLCVRWPDFYPNKFDPNDLLLTSRSFDVDLKNILDTAEPINEWTDTKKTLSLIKNRRSAFTWS